MLLTSELWLWLHIVFFWVFTRASHDRNQSSVTCHPAGVTLNDFFSVTTYLLFAWIVFLCIWALICPLVWSHLFLVSDLNRSPTESRFYKLDAGGHFKVVHINRLYFWEKIGKPLVLSSHITHLHTLSSQSGDWIFDQCNYICWCADVADSDADTNLYADVD